MLERLITNPHFLQLNRKLEHSHYSRSTCHTPVLSFHIIDWPGAILPGSYTAAAELNGAGPLLLNRRRPRTQITRAYGKTRSCIQLVEVSALIKAQLRTPLSQSRIEFLSHGTTLS